jgi:two-component system, OmpR family, copper resistance phosphate regulon response regulator CusR
MNIGGKEHKPAFHLLFISVRYNACTLAVRRKAMRILVVDDDRRLCGIIKRGLLQEGYAVDVAYDGKEAEYLTEINPYDLIIVDIMMPRKDEIQVCRGLRAKKLNTLVLMVTARDFA